MELKLGESEYRFAQIVWEQEPVASGQLVKLCAQRLGWKKSTTYTVLKNLCAKGVLCNENATVTALVKQSEVQRLQSTQLVQQTFGGSLPSFVAAFLNQNSISAEEAAQIQALIDRYKGGE